MHLQECLLKIGVKFPRLRSPIYKNEYDCHNGTEQDCVHFILDINLEIAEQISRQCPRETNLIP